MEKFATLQDQQVEVSGIENDISSLRIKEQFMMGPLRLIFNIWVTISIVLVSNYMGYGFYGWILRKTFHPQLNYKK